MKKLFAYLISVVPALVFLAVLGGCNVGSSEQPREPGDTHGEEGPADVWFVDITERAGLEEFRHRTGAAGKKWMPETFGSGGGFIDYNGDGWPDILLVGGGVWAEETDAHVPALRLYRNDGDGTFTEVTGEVGLGDIEAYGMGVTVADYDNDGDDDFYFTTLNENLLLRNEGGRFSEIARGAGVSGADEWSTCSIFFDADRDGHLDLYVCNYVEWSPETDLFCTPDGATKGYCTPQEYEGIHGRFYVNQGDGTFLERTEEAGFADVPGKSLGVTAFDYNRDEWPDLVVANDTRRDLLFENNGDGTFVETGIRSGVAFNDAGDATGGMGIDIGVVDSTGEPTVVIGNFAREAVSVFQHVSGGMFRYRSGTSKIGHPSLMTLAFGLFLFDADLDGDLDLLVANGHVQPLMAKRQDGVTYRQAPQLFLNRGDGTFEERITEDALSAKYVARGAAYGDIDRDGDQDVLITENGGPVHLLENRRIQEQMRGDDSRDRARSGSPRFLRVRLEGRTSNADGIGATVVAVTGDRKMERYVRTGSSYLSASEKTVTFGLGDAARVDDLRIYWPSGKEDHFREIQADQEVLIVEDTGIYRPTTEGPVLTQSTDS